jgi:hypothetical protein
MSIPEIKREYKRLTLNQRDLLACIRHEEKAVRFAKKAEDREAAREELEALRAEFDASNPPASYESEYGTRYLVRSACVYVSIPA